MPLKDGWHDLKAELLFNNGDSQLAQSRFQVVNHRFMGDKVTFNHYDLLGSPIARDELGNKVWREVLLRKASEQRSQLVQAMINRDATLETTKGKLAMIYSDNSKTLERYRDHFKDWSNSYPEVDVNKLDLPDKTKGVLIQYGLPAGAAPEFQFDEILLDYSDKYYHIGDGVNFNKILLEKETGAVFEFNNGIKVPINLSLSDFLYVLIVYAEMVEKAIKDEGDNVYLENKISKVIIDEFETNISQFLATYINDNNFWVNEIKRLKSQISWDELNFSR